MTGRPSGRDGLGIEPAAAPFRLSGHRALVAGASSGIGRACAIALAAAGAEVILLARSADALRALAGEITGEGGNATPVPCDVRDETGVAEALASLPCCDVMVNAAGTNEPAPLREVSAEQYERVFSLNVRGAFFLIQLLAGRLVAERRHGSLITISSQMGHVGAPLRTVYCATKHALEGLTKAAAVELAPDGIRVNTIAPTFVETEMTRPMFADPEFAADVLSRIPLGALARPSDVAAAAVFLASDAARMITGTSLLVDGGWTAR
jgi:NAD(P)-dependent dehydrogenase (short-subunit alcohol dehydrogenase family)